jgi:adenylate cyclase
LRRSEENLLDTYIGPIAGRRILAGHIRRGDVETIEAALILCDMRDFTGLADRLPETRVLELLNTYFDQIVPPIIEGGGEILKFMGDAVLGFFRGESDAARNCAAAFNAALTALARLDAVESPEARLRAGIALHHGTVSYGNIGSAPRLDFTMIGNDVNLVSRIESVCAATGRRLLMSARFAQLLGRAEVHSIGSYPLKGFDEPPELFAWTENTGPN